MKKIIIVIFLIIFSTSSYAKKNKNTWDYPFLAYKEFVTEIGINEQYIGNKCGIIRKSKK